MAGAVGIESHGPSIAGSGGNRPSGAGGGSGHGYHHVVASLPFIRAGRAVGLAAAVVAGVAMLLAGCASSGPPVPSDPELALGQEVYLARCASCHGQAGAGGLGPALAGRVAEVYPNEADQIALVTNGVSGTSMRAYADVLSPAEIAAVVRYTRESLTP